MIEGVVLATVEYGFDHDYSAEQEVALSTALSAIEGIEEVELTDGSVRIRYCPDILSRDSIRQALLRLGLTPSDAGERAIRSGGLWIVWRNPMRKHSAQNPWTAASLTETVLRARSWRRPRPGIVL